MPRFHGLRVIPVSGLSPSAFHPNSGVLVLPVRMAPASLSRRTYGASTSPTRWAKMCEPKRAGTPSTRARSLIETGMPWSGPSRPPFITASSAARAAASAASAVTVQNALIVGFTCSMRSSTARVSSTGDSAFDRIWGMSSVAGV